MSEYAVAPEAAMRRLEIVPDYDSGSGSFPHVHTFIDAGFGLVGAHWLLDDAWAAFSRHGVETSGDQAQAMKHGLVVVDPARGPVFFATRSTPRDGCPRCGDPGHVVFATGEHLCSNSGCGNTDPIPAKTHKRGSDGT
jgi:hypothetical protein